MGNMGCPHPWLGGAEFVGRATVAHYALVDLGSFPAMVEKQNGLVIGEVWNIPPDQIHVLDHYEGSTYFRKRVLTHIKKRREVPKPLHAQAYILRFSSGWEGMETFSDWRKHILQV